MSTHPHPAWMIATAVGCAGVCLALCWLTMRRAAVERDLRRSGIDPDIPLNDLPPDQQAALAHVFNQRHWATWPIAVFGVAAYVLVAWMSPMVAILVSVLGLAVATRDVLGLRRAIRR